MKAGRYLRYPWVQRGLVSLGLLVAVALWVEPGAVIAEVQRFSVGWLVLALVISVLQIMLSAWRWKFTAGLVDVPLRYGYALREYYLALLVNQLLPGGVLGDAGRAYRHAGQVASRGSAWRAVVIERASGQVAVALLTLVALLSSPLWQAVLGTTVLLCLVLVVLLLVVVAGSGVVWHRRTALIQLPAWSITLWRDMRRGLFQRRVWPWQLLSSLAIVFSYGLVMVCAARAIGIELAAVNILALAPVLLLAMLVPLSIAGWGLREGAAAGIWVFVGLPSAQGVAVSLAYGVLVLLSSLPGLWVALAKRSKATPPSLLPPDSATSAVPAADSSGASTQLNIKQHVLSTPESTHRRAQGALQGINRRHLQARPAGTNQQWRDQQVQALYRVCFNKLRHSDATPFHQYSSQATFNQQRDDIVRVELPMGIKWQHALLCSAWGGVNVWSGDMQRRRSGRGEHRQLGRNPAPWVNNNPYRVCAGNVTYGQLGIISGSSARADYHCISQRPQTVQMYQAFKAVDVVRVAAFRGNSPIKALPQLSNGPVRLGGQRCQTVQQVTGGICHRDLAVPALFAAKGDANAAGHTQAYSRQPTPRSITVNNAAICMRRRFNTIGVGHNASTQTELLHHAGPCCPTQAHLAHYIRQPGGLHVSH
ncbi:MAG: flippase-like domain-containing protein [Halomonas sp.]|nr:flippase-like domain-containing protein [Halomonas sp.]